MVWIAKFKLRNENDLYTGLCERYQVSFFAVSFACYEKEGVLHTILGGNLEGKESDKHVFLEELHKDTRISTIEEEQDFVVVHAVHKLSQDDHPELKIFYSPELIHTRPVHMARDGWEYWEVACLEREPLNNLVQAAIKYYRGELFSLEQQKLRYIAGVILFPELTEKQWNALKMAYDHGYYNYPRHTTLTELAKVAQIAYSTFQERLSRAERRIVEHLLKYR